MKRFSGALRAGAPSPLARTRSLLRPFTSYIYLISYPDLTLFYTYLRLTAELQSAVRARKSFAPKKSCNKPTTPLEYQLKYTSFAISAISLDGQTVPTFSCRENILIPTNEMQFTDRISLLRSVRSVRTDKPYMTTLSMKIF